MLDLGSFLNLLFWIVLFFININIFNFLKLFIVTEATWICLYALSVIIGVVSDDLLLISLSFLILAVAGLEFSIGFLLILLLKNIKGTTQLVDLTKCTNLLIYESSKLHQTSK